MSKTKECKKILCKYLSQFSFNRIINESDYKIINEFLSDDTIILSKKELSKLIKYRVFIDPLLDRPIFKDTDSIVPFTVEIFLDLKVRRRFYNDVNENNNFLLDEYIIKDYLLALENLGEPKQDE